MSRDPAFEDWKLRARGCDILKAATDIGAKLRRTGHEWFGPCPLCGGKDTFAVNTAKKIFVCRYGSAGGDVIALVEHVRGLDFVGACEYLTGEAPPRGRKPETDEEKQAREQAYRERIAEGERRRQREQLRLERRNKSVREIAWGIWKASTVLQGSLAEAYLRARGVDFTLDFPALRFAPQLPYPIEGEDRERWPAYPALLAAVRGPDLRFRAIWRIFLEPDGRDKLHVLARGLADEDTPKLGLAPTEGGAVWLQARGQQHLVEPIGKANIGEGLESSLGVWGITAGERPVAATLSTSGMRSFVPLASQDFTVIWPDGDTDKIRRDARGQEKLLRTPGISAAQYLHTRLKDEGKRSAIQDTPMDGQGYLDHYNAMKGRAA